MSIILTGDRATGALHLGHYVGSLKSRLDLQNLNNEIYILIANTQSLTDYFNNPSLIQNNILQLLEDYISVGIDPEKTCIFVQSEIKGLFELTCYFMNLVTLSRLQRNPTVKEELKNKSFAKNILVGFLCYPISQAADILAFKPDLIPVGIDQLPMIEQANEIANKFNNIYNTKIFKECKPLLSDNSKLLGIDGKAKASKSLNNAIFLNDSNEILKNKVFSMFTDPNHIKLEDAGNVENNMVFHYLDVFYENKEYLEELKLSYKTQGIKLGDVFLKELLFKTLVDFLTPIRERRSKINKQELKEILNQGNLKANKIVNSTLNEIYKIYYNF